jgi:hypothetical protein
MDNKISERDIETLSAYLDGQVNAPERAKLEARLRIDNEFRSVYENLRSTKALLRSAPKIRAPRNYTLSPKMVGQRWLGKSGYPIMKPVSVLASDRSSKHQYPVLGLASALASVLFVLVILSDFLVTRSLSPVTMQTLNAPIVETVELMEAPEEGEIIAESQLPGLERETPAEEEIIGTETAPVEEPAFSLEMEPISPMPTPVEELGTALPDSTQLLDSSADDAEGTTTDRDIESQPLREIATARNILRFVEIILIFVAVTCGVGAIILYRRQAG